jgi:Protein of unknown function (DUF1071)
MHYAEIRKINVNQYVEQKNGLAYLSWSWAVDQLLQLDENASWEYAEPKTFGETMMVFCTVHAFGKSRTAQLPVMDFKNRAISNPDAFSVNTAMQRCLAKAISLHGLGMYIYAGEDLPQTEKVLAPKESITPIAGALDPFNSHERDLLANMAEEIVMLIRNNQIQEAHAQCESLENDQKVALWSLLDSKSRSALKKAKDYLA